MLNLKSSLQAIALVAMVSFSGASSAKATFNAEHNDIVKTVNSYFKGIAESDEVLIAQAFELENGHIKSIVTDKETGKQSIRSQTLGDFAKIFKQPTKDHWQAHILSIDVVDQHMAMVKLNFETSKTHYIDYLVLYKFNDAWKIVNKTFVAKPKG
ncbi:hypothetical protein C1E24_04595 [Pseudoalteromonas phenolica]|uniref:Nuclear transport factor 2 family protein n=1 Tax=Pseudoalteromonas phenolica TaxID=161398 RepID=A0A5R9Q553_9GAMM|nr:nuclear transport factor 2 family protein [Pseudoalteromonas phenolica]TLX48085.1 hypothetical protein C1E24_04595 [Pseudoalteromonas phenolica]